MDKISIVIPCFNEEEAIPVYYEEMKKIMKEMSYVDFELCIQFCKKHGRQHEN